MSRKLATALIALVTTVLAAVSPAGAADLTYVSGPAGPFVGYTVPVLVVSQGDNVTYVNLDAFEHDVVARAYRGRCKVPGQDPCTAGTHPPRADWCDTAAQNPCPVFWTPLIGIAGQTPIYGLDDVNPGESYEFFCTIHANMEGTLVVLP